MTIILPALQRDRATQLVKFHCEINSVKFL